MYEKRFILKVIKCVEKHECLWNPLSLSSSHAKREQLEKAWSEIAEECEKPVAFCRDKWKNVRTGFLRSLREYPESSAFGAAKIKKKPFYLHEQMQFLLPSVVRSDSSTNNNTTYASHCKAEPEQNESTTFMMEPDDSSSSDILDYRELDNFENVHLQHEGYYIKLSPSSSNIRDIQKRQTIVELDEREPPNKKYRTTNVDVEIRETIDEVALMSFFKSIAPDVLSLSVKNQRFFKRKIVELLDDFHNENEMKQMLPKHITQAFYYSNSFKAGS